MKSTILNQIIRIIRERRTELGYSQNYVAGKLDMRQSGYSDIEAGHSTLGVDRLLAVSSLLNLSPAHLLEGKKQFPTDFSKLFYLSPEPMWFFDPVSLRFLEVNDAAVRDYGFTRADFMSMTISDIRPREDAPILYANLKDLHGDKTYEKPVRHWRRDKTIKYVLVTCYQVEFGGYLSYLTRPQETAPFVSPITYEGSAQERFAELRILSAQLESGVSEQHAKATIERMRTLLDTVKI